MFGYVTIYHKGLAKPELDRYQAYYCGLCRTLGQKYGLPGQLTLSYDLAFIAILHSALYEPQTQFSAGRCAPHPIKARPRAANEFLDYAAVSARHPGALAPPDSSHHGTAGRAERTGKGRFT